MSRVKEIMVEKEVQEGMQERGRAVDEKRQALPHTRGKILRIGESYGNGREETSYPAATQVRVFEVRENRTAGVKSRMIAWPRWGWTRGRRREWTGNVCGINEVRMRVSERRGGWDEGGK